MSINFDITAPWSGITDVTVDGQAMVKIPKFYYKRGNAATGSKREGKTGWWVCDHAKAGYSVHPAFMKDGAEVGPRMRPVNLNLRNTERKGEHCKSD